MQPTTTAALATGFLVAILTPCLDAQQITTSSPPAATPAHHPTAAEHHFAANVIIPQSRAFRTRGSVEAQITAVSAHVDIVEQVATTTLDVELRNPGGSRIEAELVVPVPDGAAVRGFSFQGAADEPTARLLPKDEAKSTYDAIVARVRDPALLEFIGYNLVRSSVFPIEPNGTQKVRLVYEHVLPAVGDRVDYVLPRSESLDYSVPWDIKVRIKTRKPVATAYSPTHTLTTQREAANLISLSVTESARTTAGPFRLNYLLERDGMSASLMAYPDAKIDGGYFLLLAGIPPMNTSGGDSPAIKRCVTLVLDRSGSMSGKKIEQVREAALQILEALQPGEAFNVITYNDSVSRLNQRPVIKNPDSIKKARKYLEETQAGGGTNIHAALTEALSIEPLPDMLPITLFLTDGLPTVGNTSEIAIREVAMNANPHEQRIFTFGVGVDVNAPLLEKIAIETRATPTFVLPSEDVEVKVAQVFDRLAGPVLADAALEIRDADGQPAPARVLDLLPDKMPDLFADDQLILLGQYRGTQELTFRLAGNYLGHRRVFEFSFDLDDATTRNAFVPRLWASRKIGVLVDAIRQMGADVGKHPGARKTVDDPKLKELIDEVVRLSTEFGILTEYTAFLAEEGNDLSNPELVFAMANGSFVDRAISTRSGLGAVNQAYNGDFMRNQTVLNGANLVYDMNMNRVATTTVRQISDRAFYQRSGRWVDSRLVNYDAGIQPAREISINSQEYNDMARELAAEGRQGTLALNGDILLMHNDEAVLVKQD